VSTALQRLWIAASLALVLGVVGGSIASKERIRREGTVVYLRLAPVDPRSLMQGDYMALRFALAADIERVTRGGEEGAGSLAHPVGEGGFDFAAIQLDERGVASLSVDATSALRLRYRLRGGRIWIGTNAFFFEEGSAPRYERARYGEFRLDRETGEAVLVALRDESLQLL